MRASILLALTVWAFGTTAFAQADYETIRQQLEMLPPGPQRDHALRELEKRRGVIEQQNAKARQGRSEAESRANSKPAVTYSGDPRNILALIPSPPRNTVEAKSRYVEKTTAEKSDRLSAAAYAELDQWAQALTDAKARADFAPTRALSRKDMQSFQRVSDTYQRLNQAGIEARRPMDAFIHGKGRQLVQRLHETTSTCREKAADACVRSEGNEAVCSSTSRQCDAAIVAVEDEYLAQYGKAYDEMSRKMRSAITQAFEVMSEMEPHQTHLIAVEIHTQMQTMVDKNRSAVMRSVDLRLPK